MKDVDVKNFMILTNSYGYDKVSIFHESKCLKKGYKTFKDYERHGYFKIDNTLYWFGKLIKESVLTELYNISGHFYTDDESLFVNGKIFSFDKGSFTTLNQSYAKDKNNVFYSDKIIDSADSMTFSVIEEHSGYKDEFINEFNFLIDNDYSPWASDNNNLYFCGKPFLVGLIDPKSTKAMRNHILLDKDNVFYFDKIITGADSNSFECIVDLRKKKEQDKIRLFTNFFKDQENIFYLNEDARSESKDKVIKCEKRNLKKYIDDIKRIADDYDNYNLNADDKKKIERLLT